LHVKQVSDGALEPLSPKVIAGFGVDQLNIHPKPVEEKPHFVVESYKSGHPAISVAEGVKKLG
jgi:hypothetical protein